MGTYINKGNEGFRKALNSDYVDKTAMIALINKTLNTERQYTCVTRCRRFGKTMAIDMLRAYYDKSCDSHSLFEGLSISQPDKKVNGHWEDKQYVKHLNKYPVISLDITDFTTRYENDPNIVSYIQAEIKKEILQTYTDVTATDDDDLMAVLIKVKELTGEKFIMLIDEWDAICREYEKQPEVMDIYVNFLRRLFKGGSSKDVFAGVYMTGILPIKKYKTESALNNFREYSMVKPGKLAGALGFTKKETRELCEKYGMDFNKMEQWYDGYKIGTEPSMFNPYSVMEAIANEDYDSYWGNTGAYEGVSTYIQMNFDGLKDNIIKMLGGGRCAVDVTSFDNDPAIIKSRDNVLTILIHLGYLSYDKGTEECYIPNLEVRKEMEKAVKDSSWDRIAKTIEDSRALLEATLNGNESAVEKAIDLAHDENTSILAYNDENSLACVLSVAYIWAKSQYIIHRELATGKGYADLVMIPRKDVDKPAMVIELKYNKGVETAIDQIKKKNYPAKIAEYIGDLLLVGISYDKESKKHLCKIEIYHQ